MTKSYDKSPYIHRKIQKATRQPKNATKNVDYTVSRSNNSHPTGVVKSVYVNPTFPLTTKAI